MVPSNSPDGGDALRPNGGAIGAPHRSSRFHAVVGDA
jgi:hypothetical protein